MSVRLRKGSNRYDACMKVLQIVPYFPPAYAFGGPVKVVHQVSRELVKRMHEVVVWTSDAKDFGSRLGLGSDKAVDGVRVYYFRNLALMLVKKFKLFITPLLVLHSRKEIKMFDVIHLHEYRTFQNIVAAYYARKYGVPYILQAHGSLPRIMARQRLKWIYDVFFGYRLLRNASMVIALSRMEVEQYRSMGVPEEKIVVIPNGIDLSEYADLPPKGAFKKKSGIDEDEKIVLYLGRIHKIKGIDILVKAFADIVEKLEGARLVVVGPDDGALDELESLTANLGMENDVLILGPLYGRDKLEAFVDADVYVLPSRYEAFPMSVLEAVACGTPVILTENSGIAEYFRDKAGIVVKPEPKRIAQALLDMLLNHEKQNSFRENCSVVIGELSISETVSKLEEVYAEAAASS